jgi:hypothetical protein
MASPGFLSKRVKKKSQTGLTTDRYEFLGLDQAEPDLGDPLVGLSSIGANPPPILGNQYVLTAYENQTGKRYWTAAAQITGSGLIPGSFTVFNNNVQVGAANSFNKFNFVGSGVTVDPVSSDINLQTGIATVRITVSDVVAPGNLNSIPYKASNGFLAGATDFVYSSTNTNVGIGSTQPTVKLDVVGDIKVLGIVTASSFVGSLTGIASTATQLETTRYFSVSGDVSTGSSVAFNGTQNVELALTLPLSGVTSATYGSTTSIPSISVNSKGIITGVTTSAITVGDGTLDLNTSGTGLSGIATFTANQVTGTAVTFTVTSNATHLNTASAIVARDASGNFRAGIITAATFSGTATTATGLTTDASINTTGIITATGGFVGSLTGIASTATNVVGGIASVTSLNVGTGGTIITTIAVGLVGIGTTNPRTPLQVETYGVKTGVGTFTASVGVSTTIDSFSVSSTDFKIAEYTVHIGFGSSIQAQKVLVTQDQSTAYSQEYGVVYNNSLLVSIGATISGGNCILQATPQTGVSGLTTYRFARNTLL